MKTLKENNYVAPEACTILLVQKNVVCASPGDGLVITYNGFDENEEEW